LIAIYVDSEYLNYNINDSTIQMMKISSGFKDPP